MSESNTYETHEVTPWTKQLEIGGLESEEIELVLRNSNELEITFDYEEEGRDDYSTNHFVEKVSIYHESMLGRDPTNGLMEPSIEEGNELSIHHESMSDSEPVISSTEPSMEEGKEFSVNHESMLYPGNSVMKSSREASNELSIYDDESMLGSEPRISFVHMERGNEFSEQRESVENMSTSSFHQEEGEEQNIENNFVPNDDVTVEISSFYEDHEAESLSTRGPPVLWHIIVSSTSSVCSTTITNLGDCNPEEGYTLNKDIALDHRANDICESPSFKSVKTSKTLSSKSSIEENPSTRFEELYKLGKEKIRSDLNKYYVETRKIRINTTKKKKFIKRPLKRTMRLSLPASARIEELYIYGKHKVRSDREKHLLQQKKIRPSITGSKSLLNDTLELIRSSSFLVRKQACQMRMEELYIFGRDKIRAELRRYWKNTFSGKLDSRFLGLC